MNNVSTILHDLPLHCGVLPGRTAGELLALFAGGSRGGLVSLRPAWRI